jgi:hypothetical protein
MAAVCACLALAACGGSRLDATEPSGKFMVEVPTATFPTSQTLSQHSHLVIAVHNVSPNKTIPDVAVTICNVTCSYPAPPGEGTSAQAFSEDCQPLPTCLTSAQQHVANPSRPVWVVDMPPGNCTGTSGYSCAAGGAGSGDTIDANTWTLGPLKPGATAKFMWALTAVSPGRHQVAWQVSAGLTGKAKALLSNGSIPAGAFTVTIQRKATQSYVSGSGQIVPTP